MHKTPVTAGLATLAVGALLGLAGCASGGAGAQAAPSPAVADKPSVAATSTTTASPSSAGPKTSPRGKLVKQVGEKGGVGSTDGSYMTVEFTLAKITPKPQCTSHTDPPKGHTFQLDFDITTGPNTQDTRDVLATWNLNVHSFSVVDGGGTTTELPSFYCGIESGPITGYSPASHYKDVIVIDSPVEHGVLTFNPTGTMSNGVTGWEWQF